MEATETVSSPGPTPDVPMPPPQHQGGDGLDDLEIITMRQLLEAGVHFGHQTKHWNPKMRTYIYGVRGGIHIVDLQQTAKLFRAAYRFLVQTVASGRSVLFVGTKKQAQEVVAEEAARANQFYVTTRWLGGTLTNWRTIKQTIDRLVSIERMRVDGTFERITKKEALGLDREAQKLERNLKGIKNLPELPGALFVIDPKKEHIAIREALRLEIPVVGVTDTNCDPDEVDYVIPGNDDAIRAIRLFAAKAADACLVGARVAKERAATARDRERDREREPAEPETIRVSSGGDGPKVEVVSRRGAPRPEPEASSDPE